MAHIIEVIRSSEVEARSFLDALYYSDFVSGIGFRICEDAVRVVAVNWNEDVVNEIDEQILQMVTASLESGEDLDEISAYCRISPETIPYNFQWKAG